MTRIKESHGSRSVKRLGTVLLTFEFSTLRTEVRGMLKRSSSSSISEVATA
jgi:hypothetical protein